MVGGSDAILSRAGTPDPPDRECRRNRVRHERTGASCPRRTTAASRSWRAGALGAGAPPLPGLPGGGLIDRPGLSDDLIDELLGGARTAQEIAGPDGLLGQLTRRLLERALEAEITEHLGYVGIWFQRSEGAKFWLQVLTDLKTRGVADVLVCCVDGLTGFPEAIEAVFPQTWVQTCLVHQVRSNLRFVPYRDKRAVASDLKRIYTAVDQDAAADELQHFAAK